MVGGAHPLGDVGRPVVFGAQHVERVVRVGEELVGALEDLALWPQQSSVEVMLRPLAHLAVGDPVGAFVVRARDEGLAIPGDLCPDEGLHPVHPRGAEFERMAHALFGPGATADAVARLEDLHLESGGLQFASCHEPGETGADDKYLGGCRHVSGLPLQGECSVRSGGMGKAHPTSALPMA